MAMIVIQTQIFENYGEENDPYWKAKGGCEYKIRNIPLNTDYEEIISIANIETNNAFLQEYILKSQLEYDGSITYPEPSVEYADLIDERTVA
jgi:hypothetical protein